MYSKKRERKEKDKVWGSLLMLRQLPSLSCFTICLETVVTNWGSQPFSHLFRAPDYIRALPCFPLLPYCCYQRSTNCGVSTSSKPSRDKYGHSATHAIGDAILSLLRKREKKRVTLPVWALGFFPEQKAAGSSLATVSPVLIMIAVA